MDVLKLATLESIPMSSVSAEIKFYDLSLATCHSHLCTVDVLDWVKESTGLTEGCPKETTAPTTAPPTTAPPVCTGCCTVGGDDPNKKCVFPFIFAGVTYNECTDQAENFSNVTDWR